MMYVVHTYSDPRAFGSLAEGWNQLAQGDERCTVFQSWTWVSHMWELEARGNVALRLVTVVDGDGRLLAVAPMLVERQLGILNVRVLRFIGDQLSDRQDLLLARGADERAVIDRLAGWLSSDERDWDIVDLENLAETSRFVRNRQTLFPELRGRKVALESSRQDFCVPVVGSWEDYRASLKRSVRRTLQRRSRKLEADHAARVWTEDGSVDPVRSLRAFVRLHQRRQESKKERGLFHDEARTRLLLKLFHAMLKQGTMRLHFIDVDRSPKAVQAVLSFNRQSHWYNVGLDPTPSLLPLGLGKLLCFTALADAFRSGQANVDLGSGAHSYKADFASDRIHTYRIREFHSATKGWIYRMRGTLLHSARNSRWLRELYFALGWLRPGRARTGGEIE